MIKVIFIKNVSRLANKICVTFQFFTNHLKHISLNKTTCRTTLANPPNYANIGLGAFQIL